MHICYWAKTKYEHKFGVNNAGIRPLVRHCCERVAVKKAAQSGLYAPREVPRRAVREAQEGVTSL